MIDPHSDNSKGWYTAQELAGLPGMPESVSAVIRFAKKNLWKTRRKMRGKGQEYALESLPEPTRAHILRANTPVCAPPLPAGAVRNGQIVRLKADPHALTDAQRRYQSAALVLCHAVEEQQAQANASVRQGCYLLAQRIVAQEADPSVLQAAHHTYQKPRKGGPLLGGHTALFDRLMRLMGFYEAGRMAGDTALYLVPKPRQNPAPNPLYVQAFLRFYCHPSRPPVAEVTRKMAAFFEEQGLTPPHYNTVCRLEKTLPVTVKYRGRVTGSEWRALKPYIERDVSMFRANDIWVGDGHSFKAKIQHPIHGQPFTPEVTVILDWVSRKIVGWSVSLSESTLAVSDAFRHAQTLTRARPLVYYSDNGAGQTGKQLDCPLTGTLARQGIAHETGIPGNPQGRGLIERLWQVTLIPLARDYPTCTWRGADQNATTAMIKRLSRKDQGGITLPTWRQFLDDVHTVVSTYNLEHAHSALGGQTPEDVYQAKLDRDSIVFGPSDAELASLWMPEVVRVPQRGWIHLFGNTYCKPDLIDQVPQGEKVRVRYDLHNANRIWILNMEGVYLGAADWDSHKHAAFPVPQIDELRAKRAAGKVLRGEKIIAEAQAELAPMLDMEALSPAPVVDLATMITDEALAEMEARTAQRTHALPDLLAMASQTPEAPTQAQKPDHEAYMEMALWLSGEGPEPSGFPAQPGQKKAANGNPR
jgi:putative transposase